MNQIVAKNRIYTGDTTTHGGILNDGCENDTRNGSHRSVLVGHKFWCPQCHCWSEFTEGASNYTVHGRHRVLEGHRTSCGAAAIHQLGFNDTCEDATDNGLSSEISLFQDIRREARMNQSTKGEYAHRFHIRHDGESPVSYVVFKNGVLLDAGTARNNSFDAGTSVDVTTSQRENIYLAIQAPRPQLK